MTFIYVFLVLAHERRRILHFAVTAHPAAEWTVRGSCITLLLSKATGVSILNFFLGLNWLHLGVPVRRLNQFFLRFSQCGFSTAGLRPPPVSIFGNSKASARGQAIFMPEGVQSLIAVFFEHL